MKAVYFILTELNDSICDDEIQLIDYLTKIASIRLFCFLSDINYHIIGHCVIDFYLVVGNSVDPNAKLSDFLV